MRIRLDDTLLIGKPVIFCVGIESKEGRLCIIESISVKLYYFFLFLLRIRTFLVLKILVNIKTRVFS